MSDWDVFGSDSDEDEIVEEQNNIDNPTITTTISSSKNILQAKINASLEKSTDAIITFSIQKLIKTNRSVKLPQRYFGIVENQEVVQHNTQDEKTYEIMNAWNNNMCSKIQQRGMKLVNVNHQNNESEHSLFDVASIGRIFTIDIPSQKLIDYDLGAEAETIESSIRRDLVAGGLLLVTMVIKAEIDMNNEEWTAQSLLQQWKTGIQDNTVFTKAVWDIETASIIYSDRTIKADSSFAEVYTISLTKRPCTVNTLSCPWKTNHKKVPTSFYDDSKNNEMDESWIDYERRILSSATISQSIHEQNEGLLTADNIEKAVKALQTHGFVILPGLFREQSNLEMVQSWSNAVLQDFDRAAIILKEKNNVDILNPGEGLDPISYREMAMREDLRVDLRDGPAMKEFRSSIEQSDKKALQNLQYKIIDGGDGTTPIIIDKNQSSSFINENQTHSLPTPSLRFNPFVLEIIQKLQNPQSSDSENQQQDQTPPLYKGNFGRWNFSGSGPNGSAQPVRVGHIGSVISLPGSADQCIHADTPHIFEIYDRLPCHYANLFIMGKDMNASNNNSVDHDGNFTGENLVGGTAFIDGSHHLSVTARLTEDKGISAAGVDNSTQNEMHMRIIRPSLRTGDALLFDTRTLHFGLANNSERIRRPLLYVNMTHSWFFDPKNWDNKQSIFE